MHAIWAKIKELMGSIKGTSPSSARRRSLPSMIASLLSRRSTLRLSVRFFPLSDSFYYLSLFIYLGVSTDSHFSHLAWTQKPRNEGGLGPDLVLPLLADKSMKISRDYGVLLEEGVALRGLFIIDPKGTLRQITVNDLPVGRSVEETLRLVKAFQFTVRSTFLFLVD